MTTLAPSSDDDQARGRSTLGPPGGQLVAPWEVAQLGLDGRAYAPGGSGAQAPESARSADPHLGTPHGVLHRARQDELRARLDASRALRLPGFAAAPEAPQLTLWDRLEEATRLLVGTAFDRQAKCNRVRILPPGTPIPVTRSTSGAVRFRGVVKCDHMTCPACGVARAGDTARALGALFDAHLAADPDQLADDEDPDVWMLTLTVPHYPDGSVEETTRVLFTAAARFFRARAWRRFKERWGVIGTVRVLDPKFSTRGNGPHPHFHVALLPKKASFGRCHLVHQVEELKRRIALAKEPASRWELPGDIERRARHLPVMEVELAELTAECAAGCAEAQRPLRSYDAGERAELLREFRGGLLPAWEAAVLAAGGEIHELAAFRARSLELTPGEESAAYFTSWSLSDEVGATHAKTETHLALLDKSAAGDDDAGRMFFLWRRAVDGRAWVTGLDDALAAAGVTVEAIEAHAADKERRRAIVAEEAGKPLPWVPELRLEIPSYLWTAALALGLGRVAEIVGRAVDEAEARAELIPALLRALPVARPSRRLGGRADHDCTGPPAASRAPAS